MADPRQITFEPGSFDWTVGRGYELPADGSRQFPPGWTDPNPPPFKEASSSFSMPRPVQHQSHAEVVEAPENPSEIMAAVEQAVSQVIDPNRQKVELDQGWATFRGHVIHLSPAEKQAIEIILAGAVIRGMERERDNILASVGLVVQHQDVQEPTSTERTDVSEVQEQAAQVVAKPPRD